MKLDAKCGDYNFIYRYYWWHLFMHYFSQIFKINFLPQVLFNLNSISRQIQTNANYRFLDARRSLSLEANCTRNLNKNICLTSKRWCSLEVEGCDFRISRPEALCYKGLNKAVLYNIGRKSVFFQLISWEKVLKHIWDMGNTGLNALCWNMIVASSGAA